MFRIRTSSVRRSSGMELLSVSFALNVGYSIENAFGQAVEELDSDVWRVIRILLCKVQTYSCKAWAE